MASKKSELVEGLVAKGIEYRDDSAIDIQKVSESDLAKLAASEAFMEERVKIVIHPTTDANAPPFAQVSVNGEGAIVGRNIPTWVKRKHLEVLARMKETRVSQDMTPNASGEITTASLRGHSGLAYPFAVIEDKNARGGAWLANILAEGA